MNETDPHMDANTNTSLPYYLAEEFAMHTNRPLFITGKAGTGKTTFLRKLREQTPKNMAVVAPTGVAAINAGGMTIHSFFQLPVRTLIPTPQAYKQLFAEQRLTQRKRNLIYHLEMLVIDEISMVRADVLDAIDAVLRRYKYRKDQPFGGVQVVMIGDLFQLSPVVTRGEDEEAMKKYYDGPYFFQAKVMQELHPIYVELDHIFRQQDRTFVQLLNEVRENQLTAQGRALFSARYNPRFKNTDEDFHITLTTHNRLADELNERELAKLPDEPRVFTAEIKKDFPVNIYPTEEELTLKTGARVMFVRNDDQKPRRFYNGKIGVITEIDSDKITVRCEDGDIEVTRMVWENIRYREDERYVHPVSASAGVGGDDSQKPGSDVRQGDHRCGTCFCRRTGVCGAFPLPDARRYRALVTARLCGAGQRPFRAALYRQPAVRRDCQSGTSDRAQGIRDTAVQRAF